MPTIRKVPRESQNWKNLMEQKFVSYLLRNSLFSFLFLSSFAELELFYIPILFWINFPSICVIFWLPKKFITFKMANLRWRKLTRHEFISLVQRQRSLLLRQKIPEISQRKRVVRKVPEIFFQEIQDSIPFAFAP